MEYQFEKYTMTAEFNNKLMNKMNKITKINDINEHDLGNVIIIDEKGRNFASIVYNSQYTDIELLIKLYYLIFQNDNDKFLRSRNYLIMRKYFHLETGETIITIGSYLQSSGITDPVLLLNKLLLIIECAFEY